LTESRSRRVIVVENPFLPDPIKRIIGEVLLDNLQVSLRKVNISPIYPRSPFPSNLSLFSFLYSSLFGFSEILTVELTDMSISALRCSSRSAGPVCQLHTSAHPRSDGCGQDDGVGHRHRVQRVYRSSRESWMGPLPNNAGSVRPTKRHRTVIQAEEADECDFLAVIYHLVLC